MWRPRTEVEIQIGIDNRATVESASFDAKVALPAPGKNKDLAKDICAMTVDGGALLYGVGGDDPTRPDRRVPFDTRGTRERVDSVAQTGISEPPVIDVYEIDSDEEPGKGYLCIVVPPSPRAPHMLTAEGDNRYWGRGLAGNRILSEREVARLYERRGEWEVDRGEVLSKVLAKYPFDFEASSSGVVLATVQPVAPGRELLRIAADGTPINQLLQREMTESARRRDPYPGQGTSGLGDAFQVAAAQADVWIACHDPDKTSRYQAYAEFRSDGSFSYWHSPIVNETRSGVFIMEQSVTRAVYQPLAVAAWLFDRAGFYGSMDVAVVVLGLEGLSGASHIHGFGPFPSYGAAEYRRQERVTGEELRADMDGVVTRLLRPLYEVISVPNYDPFAARAQ